MPCSETLKDVFKSFLWLLKEGDVATVAKALCPLFTLGLGLIVGGIVESWSAWDEPSRADYCYVCDEDPCDTPYVGDCNEQGGCWCRGEDYSDYFCADTGSTVSRNATTTSLHSY